MNINKNSLPEGGRSIVENSNVVKRSVSESLEISVISDVNFTIGIDSKRRAREFLEIMGLHDCMHHSPRELSGVQFQRVSIARALINDYAILLADEPTGNLDSTTGAEILRIFMDLNLEGRTVVIITNEPEIAKYTERVILVKDEIFNRIEGGSICK